MTRGWGGQPSDRWTSYPCHALFFTVLYCIHRCHQLRSRRGLAYIFIHVTEAFCVSQSSTSPYIYSPGLLMLTSWVEEESLGSQAHPHGSQIYVADEKCYTAPECRDIQTHRQLPPNAPRIQRVKELSETNSSRQYMYRIGKHPEAHALRLRGDPDTADRQDGQPEQHHTTAIMSRIFKMLAERPCPASISSARARARSIRVAMTPRV